jgi:hypothetical protein
MDSGFKQDLAHIIISNVNQELCFPPKPQNEIDYLVDYGYRKYEVGKDSYGIYEDKKGNSKNTEIHRWTIAELLDAKFPEPKWAVPGLIPEGLILVGGRPKVGKSWLILDLAHAVSKGGMFLGRKVEQGNVLYISLEDNGRRLQERTILHNISKDSHLTLVNQWKPLQEEGYADLLNEIEIYDYRMIIIDPLNRAFPGLAQGKDPERISKILGDLQTIAINKPFTLIFIDHTRKNGNTYPDPIEDILNTTGKVSVADCVLGLYKNQGKKGARLLGRGKDIAEIELDLFWDINTKCWQEENQSTEIKDEYLEALKTLGKCKASSVAKYLNKDRGNTSKKLQSLFIEGKCQSEEDNDIPYYWIEEDSPF